MDRYIPIAILNSPDSEPMDHQPATSEGRLWDTGGASCGVSRGQVGGLRGGGGVLPVIEVRRYPPEGLLR
jgi:hypothetical protein